MYVKEKGTTRLRKICNIHTTSTHRHTNPKENSQNSWHSIYLLFLAHLYIILFVQRQLFISFFFPKRLFFQYFRFGIFVALYQSFYSILFHSQKKEREKNHLSAKRNKKNEYEAAFQKF